MSGSGTLSSSMPMSGAFAHANGFQGSYANDRPPSSTGSGEADIASDPASSSFFVADYKKHEDLKNMLDSNKDNLKLEAMKRIIGMVAKGKDASDLFPAVVKNVVSKNIEVKKLVYVYLVRYAEEQQDLALLSIATFQRALKDPNQLIRASALRVLSSIRVPMIVPIMMLAIKEAVMDMSPYVRKTAAHAIPKLYSLDPEQKNILIEVIEKLLADKTTLVAGSAIQAFEEVCPERIDLIHKNYRKLCNLLVDVEEWGQVVIINMLTRYCRSQFLDPNSDQVEKSEEDSEKNFYESSVDSGEEKEEEVKRKRSYVMDSDHRLLLRTCKPLLNSRNASVVMAVAQLYHHCAPRSEVALVIKALIRLLRGHREVQYVVLSNIASMSVKHKGMFEPYLKSFYVRSNDALQCKLLKLEILTTLATETNISTILREFQTYVTSSDKQFAAATIQAIGRCASNISEVTDTCLNGLVSLLSNRDEVVVGESVVVIKKLLQTRPTEHKDIISHLAKLVDTITVAMAKASILWLIGEYSDRVPLIAPDVLRKMAKNFTNEEDIVKLQILTLATKLFLTNPKQTKLLCQYVLNLAKYDQNYDLRDRARFLRALILPQTEKPGALAKHAKKIFLASKPAPVLNSVYNERDEYQLATLSHLIHNRAQGYQELPVWPHEAPDPNVRNVEVVMPWTEQKTAKSKRVEKKKSFYSETESSAEDDSESESEDGSSSYESSSSSASETSSEASSADKKLVNGRDVASSPSGSSTESSSEESSSDSDKLPIKSVDPPTMPEASGSHKPEKLSKQKQSVKVEKLDESTNRPTDILLDLDFDAGPTVAGATLHPTSVMSPQSTPVKSTPKPNYNIISPIQNEMVEHPLLDRITGKGLAATYAFTRTVSIFSPQMVSVELHLSNTSEKSIHDLHMQITRLPPAIKIQEFPNIDLLAAGQNSRSLLGINFNDTTQPASFNLVHQDASFQVTIIPSVGEMLQPNTLTENDFLQIKRKLTGMTEASGTVSTNQNQEELCHSVYSVANVLQVASSSNTNLYFAGRTVAAGVDVLITLLHDEHNLLKVTVNCEKMVIGNVLLKDIKAALK